MGLFFSEVIGALIQLLIFLLLPFLLWIITARANGPFCSWVGLHAPKQVTPALIGWSAAMVCATFLLGVGIQWMMAGAPVAASKFADLGYKAIPAILVFAFFGTAFGEEIFFRGFLLKRFQSLMTFQQANILQAALFGLIHGIMFFTMLPFFSTLLIIVFTGLVGWALGMINERLAGGSIVPSWLIHAAANLFAGLSMAFVLFSVAAAT